MGDISYMDNNDNTDKMELLNKEIVTSATEIKQTHQLGIYIHIPFCIKKCNYCDFLSAPASDDIINRYIKALNTQIKSYKDKTGAYTVSTIFIGGGTPSILNGEDIIKIMEELDRIFVVNHKGLEATIELNPGTVTKEKLAAYRKAGINRLSFGLQSADNNELKLLGRIHTYEEFLLNFYTARELGFKNINVDLMSALPKQTVKSWEDSLTKIADLQPEHISAYSLIIEEGTPFYELYNENGPLHHLLPDEETDRSIYHLTKDFLTGRGYNRYEISNYARAGFESRHNISYWTGIQYLGLGLGAASLVNEVRFNNTSNLMTYITKCEEFSAATKHKVNVDNNMQPKNTPTDKIPLADLIGIRRDITRLYQKQRMEEFMFLGLRMQKGISTKDFYDKFGCDINSVYGDIINKHAKNGLLAMNGDRIYLTEYGIDVSNYVLSDFIFDSEQ